jgi:hypothetical protein
MLRRRTAPRRALPRPKLPRSRRKNPHRRPLTPCHRLQQPRDGSPSLKSRNQTHGRRNNRRRTRIRRTPGPPRTARRKRIPPNGRETSSPPTVARSLCRCATQAVPSSLNLASRSVGRRRYGGRRITASMFKPRSPLPPPRPIDPPAAASTNTDPNTRTTWRAHSRAACSGAAMSWRRPRCRRAENSSIVSDRATRTRQRAMPCLWR